MQLTSQADRTTAPPKTADSRIAAPEEQRARSFAGVDEFGILESPVTTGRTENELEGGAQLKNRVWKRRLTMLPQARAESRPFTNKYFFRRPTLLQYYHQGALFDSHGRRFEATRGDELMMPSRSNGEGGDEDKDYVETDSDTSMKQRDWLNLFIDLLWVGILSNVGDEFVAQAFKNQNFGDAILEFLVLYLTAFRFWSYLRKFLNNFFNKDFIQSLFVSWCLILALLFGNQTAYFLTPGGANIVIWTYLIVRSSFFWIEVIYCFYIPQIRRETIITYLLAIPIAVMWGVAAVIKWPARATPILIALAAEGLISVVLASPVGEWLLRGAPRKAIDAENLVDRLQGFFIIVLGEGVYTLIVGGKWGSGITEEFGLGVEALFILYSLFWHFFYGDHTKTYVHAMYRNRYTSILFQFLHGVLYGAVLLVVASIGYIIEEDPNITSTSEESESLPDGIRTARWTLSGSIALTLFVMAAIPLLNRSLDQPKTLFINNRYLRMAPRMMACIVILCIPIKESLSNTSYLGILLAIMQFSLFIEYIGGMEPPFLLWEPKTIHE